MPLSTIDIGLLTYEVEYTVSAATLGGPATPPDSGLNIKSVAVFLPGSLERHEINDYSSIDDYDRIVSAVFKDIEESV